MRCVLAGFVASLFAGCGQYVITNLIKGDAAGVFMAIDVVLLVLLCAASTFIAAYCVGITDFKLPR